MKLAAQQHAPSEKDESCCLGIGTQGAMCKVQGARCKVQGAGSWVILCYTDNTALKIYITLCI